ncbi:Fic family protein [Methylobacillus sp. Pita1]|uniref:Fic family protein n=1 Tax=Methylobacillus sp. Pita1 TaxID=3382642 RepID=UPI0038B49A40
MSSIIRAPAASGIEQFEPLFPSQAKLEPLLSLAHQLQTACWKLGGNAMPGLHTSLTPLLRAMNSYYTNKIEGQQTLPADIEDALHSRFSSNPDKARRQRLALAHLDTEQWAENTYAAADWRNTFAPDVICSLHRHLYEGLPIEDRVTDSGEPVNEGMLRDHTVKVGMHMATTVESLPLFLQRWQAAYSKLPDGEHALIGLACAHHRLAWIHPFRDGNGRVTRLHSHLALHNMGLTNGLWSPMRGLARRHEEYYARLVDADEPRQGDYDGRGALSEQGLVRFAEFFLQICLDQAQFMGRMLNLAEFRERLDALLSFEGAKSGTGLRKETLIPLHYIAINGPMERGQFKPMTGMSDRTAERALKSLLDYGLLRSDTPKGKIYFGIPLRSLRFLFPNLWPEAEAQIYRPANSR